MGKYNVILDFLILGSEPPHHFDFQKEFTLIELNLRQIYDRCVLQISKQQYLWKDITYVYQNITVF